MSLIHELADKHEKDMLRNFKHIHQNPELSCHEKDTTAYIAGELRNIGLEPNVNYPEYGVSAVIKGGKPGKTILLRADIDALPIDEKTECEYASQKAGVMHACGHDVHASGLLGAARILYDLRDTFSGNVKLCFQPAEEVPHHGARKMVEAGIMENPRVDFSVGTHINPLYRIGEVGVLAGPVSAFPDRFTVTLHGQGGHASSPNTAKDPIGPALTICQMIYEFHSHFEATDVVLIQITRLEAGHVENIIPDECTIGACVRTASIENRKKVKGGIEKIIESVCKLHGITYTLQGFNSDCPIIINDEEAVELAKKSFAKLGLQIGDPTKINVLGAEDFGFFSNESGVPGVFFNSGCSTEDPATHHPLHNAMFLADQRVVSQNAITLSQIAVDFLSCN